MFSVHSSLPHFSRFHCNQSYHFTATTQSRSLRLSSLINPGNTLQSLILLDLSAMHDPKQYSIYFVFLIRNTFSELKYLRKKCKVLCNPTLRQPLLAQYVYSQQDFFAIHILIHGYIYTYFFNKN